ncbi:50S ribosomal protein L11 methyltransferase, partial [Acidisphaera rubrifaciens]|uniref:50S ribosomal protein L11 methyltransferase n=1 Tax=Acidisphaera rubrifaciens TaxID=50715 RepID=UPI00066261B5
MSAALARRRAAPLETVAVDVPEDAVEAYEQALASVCATVGLFLDDTTGIWRIEGVREAGADWAPVASALAVAALVSGVDVPAQRVATEADGWLARTQAAFPPQPIGRRFTVRGTHLPAARDGARLVLVLDAGVAF